MTESRFLRLESAHGSVFGAARGDGKSGLPTVGEFSSIDEHTSMVGGACKRDGHAVDARHTIPSLHTLCTTLPMDCALSHSSMSPSVSENPSRVWGREDSFCATKVGREGGGEGGGKGNSEEHSGMRRAVRSPRRLRAPPAARASAPTCAATSA